ncbi:MAG TPA: hypothetical protein PLJ16_05095 [Casimicrobium huifangae]|uniref:hypothetical protein n=2 Tax=Casimicrobium huifangae TaxID=2591109 RepID=UPI002C0303D8|nr:hypothetical protein [Casimicrobium huifangae]HQD64582.1 hypothetical protein [Casimicrobium huifangae]
MKPASAVVLSLGLIVSGCGSVPRSAKVPVTEYFAGGLSDTQLCSVAANGPWTEADGVILVAEYEKRVRAGRLTQDRCQSIQRQALIDARAIAKAKEDGAAAGRLMGDIIGTVIGAAAVGAAGYYGAKAGAPAPTYQIPAPSPVPAAVPYVPPPPLTKMLLTREPDTYMTQGIFMVTCRYAASSTVIRVPMHQPCPESVPN